MASRPEMPVYEPPTIEQRTPISVPLIGQVGSIAPTSAAFRPL
jgi:hypothetical protein